jgi:RNA polymerase sigma factor for flagellar operon FliA
MSEALSPERARWVEQCMPQVTALARVLGRDMPQVSEEDLVSAGYEGLVHAALRYDPKDGTPFPAYAHYRVRGAMIDTARRAAPEIRRRARAIRALEATQALLQHAQRNLVHRDVADPRSLHERVAAAAELVAQTTTAVILSRLGPEDPDILVSTDVDMETRVLDEEERRHVRRALATCNADESRMIDALYVRGVSMREFASEVGKSVSSVSRHHAKLIARLSGLLRRPVPDHAPAPAPAAPAPPPRAEVSSGLGARGPPDARDS